jgi:hypothetical protein
VDKFVENFQRIRVAALQSNDLILGILDAENPVVSEALY